jgi:hypothetical protein
MTPAREKKYLSAVLNQIDNGPPKWLRNPWAEFAFLFGPAVVLYVLSEIESVLTPMVLSIAMLIIGVAIGYFGMLLCAVRQWPLLKPHINRDSVAERISSLEP